MSPTRTMQSARSRRTSWTAPKSRRWFTAFISGGMVLVATYVVAAFLSSITPGRGAGLTFGILAAILLGICMALGLRKRFKHLPLGRTMHWLQLHIYAGTLFLLLVFMHTGFSLPSGAQTWAIFLLTILVSLSGIAGAWLQKWIPHTLASGLQVEAIYERIPELVDGLRAEAEQIVDGASQALVDFHRAELAPALAGPEPGFGFLFDIAGGRTQEMMLFNHVSARLSAAEKEKLNDLKQILVEKNNLDAQLSLQRVLRFWLFLHIPASAVLLALVLVHIGAWVYY